MKVQGKPITEAKPHETGIVRNVNSVKELTTTLDDKTKTLYDVLANAVKRYGDNDAVGYRDLIKEHVEEKMITKVVNNEKKEIPKKWSYFELSDYKYLSFNQFYEKTMRLAGGLRKFGLKAGDKLELYASTTSCWLMMAHAAMSQSMSIVTAYETLGEEGLLHSLRETDVHAIFTEANLLGSLVNPLKEVNLHYIIYRGKAKSEDIEALKQSRADIKLISYNELESFSEPATPEPPSPDDLCCTMYTSGSTGLPKGVLLTHRNMVALISAVCKIIPEVTSKDYLLAYLPLAHILEFAFENLCLAWGGTIGYAGVRTLTDTNCRNCHGDILSFRPTIMVGVPAVWEMVRKGIASKLDAASSVKKSVFWAAYHTKLSLMRHGIPGSSFLDAAVFNKIRTAGTGGRLRYVLSGGSALNPDTKKFLSVVLCPVLIGYGLTEVSAAAMIEVPSTFNVDDSAGVILPCTELKLIDCEEGSYYVNSNPPRGEILLRGPSLTKGYLNRDQENKESFSKDGWFMTGDVGELTPHGLLKIIDRKKNLVKTQNGEYIALEKLESRYRSSSLVANICVYADQSKVKPIAVIVPNETTVHKLAVEKAGVDENTSWEDICKNKKVRHLVLEDLLKIGRSQHFANIELVQNVVLVPIEFTPENGFVTAAQKLQRRKIIESFSKDVDEAYAE
ncbi:long-chain-fatty-acid-CoA ligase Lcf1 [Schizosaccharomyces cryophilus OY26]|uniref:Long-chain-fatty-acid-CoA ligase Lcf1 n=1 Tax=Schizosaccharomyces cryophilus (strain OY26 / ATCC MYA-4695 / CBS 11777 / NBRC 106824 / NRRL Y48691) TaxID=653667 RepID=S9XGZ4_SCHCR|nr:long-chain-fatty-acid-CoA ligase Lcf1 [Schizosaccharomyces cryophilus OY26]EPY52941.1 long-chain-fatty-acid-CoA ligase Lcf1 [Schizosaccharomyces cryophilus OY26]